MQIRLHWRAELIATPHEISSNPCVTHDLVDQRPGPGRAAVGLLAALGCLDTFPPGVGAPGLIKPANRIIREGTPSPVTRRFRSSLVGHDGHRLLPDRNTPETPNTSLRSL
jgi:hypothetical protein